MIRRVNKSFDSMSHVSSSLSTENFRLLWDGLITSLYYKDLSWESPCDALRVDYDEILGKA